MTEQLPYTAIQLQRAGDRLHSRQGSTLFLPTVPTNGTAGAASACLSQCHWQPLSSGCMIVVLVSRKRGCKRWARERRPASTSQLSARPPARPPTPLSLLHSQLLPIIPYFTAPSTESTVSLRPRTVVIVPCPAAKLYGQQCIFPGSLEVLESSQTPIRASEGCNRAVAGWLSERRSREGRQGLDQVRRKPRGKALRIICNDGCGSEQLGEVLGRSRAGGAPSGLSPRARCARRSTSAPPRNPFRHAPHRNPSQASSHTIKGDTTPAGPPLLAASAP
jgi:hypothetical protein